MIRANNYKITDSPDLGFYHDEDGENEVRFGFDNDSGLPEETAAARAPKSPCMSSKILSAFRALIFEISSGREVSAVSILNGFSCHGY